MNPLERVFEAASGQIKKGFGWGHKIISAIMLLISLSFLAYTVYVGWDQLREHFSTLNYWLLGVALLLYPIGFLPTAWAWHTTMSSVSGYSEFRENIRLYALSCLPKRIPGAVWYISSRVVLYQKVQISYATTLAATAIEIAFTALSGFSIYLLTRGINLAETESRLRGVSIGAFILTLAVPLWTPVLRYGLRFIQMRTGVSTSISFDVRNALCVLCILTLAWVGGGSLLYVTASAIVPLPLVQLPDVIGSWGAAGAISVTAGLLVQGMGLREVTLAILLSSCMPLSAAAVVSLLFRLLLTVGEFVWALIFARLASWWPK